MKRVVFILFAFILGAAAVLTTGCSKDGETIYQEENQPLVTVKQQSPVSKGEVTVSFEPNELASKVSYAIVKGTGTDRVERSEFRDGEMEGIVTKDTDEAFTVVFADLIVGETYTVFAKAEGKSSKEGPVASVQIYYIENMDVTNQYVTDYSAAFKIDASLVYISYSYALGTANDKAAFENGTLKGINTLKDVKDFVASYFDLQPDTEYVFFTKAQDRFGLEYPTIEIPIKTFAVGECPGFTSSPLSQDLYRGVYNYVPNDKCGKLGVLMSNPGTYDFEHETQRARRGDVMGTLDYWIDLELDRMKVAENASLDVTFDTPRLEFDSSIDTYVIIYDKAGKPFGVRRLDVKTPSKNPQAPVASLTVTVGQLTDTSVAYTVTFNENTLGIVSNVMTNAEYERYKNDEAALRNYVNGNNFIYAPSVTSPHNYTITRYMPSGETNYLLIYPLNANGYEGWGEGVKIKFTIP